MCEIARGVDLAAAKIEDRLPALALTENDEQYISDCLQNMVDTTSSVFNDGLKVDEIFERLEQSVKSTLEQMEFNKASELAGNKYDKRLEDPDATVELF